MLHIVKAHFLLVGSPPETCQGEASRVVCVYVAEEKHWTLRHTLTQVLFASLMDQQKLKI